MPRTRKRPARYAPEEIPDDDSDSSEIPSDVSSDAEIIEIDLTQSSEEKEANAISSYHMPVDETSQSPAYTREGHTLGASHRHDEQPSQTTSTSSVAETTSIASSAPDVVPTLPAADRGPKRSVEFLCVVCSTLNRFEALNCKYCNTLQRFVVCSHCLVTSDFKKTVHIDADQGAFI